MSKDWEARILNKIEGLLPDLEKLEDYFQYLIESEQQAIALYENAKNPSGPPPIVPPSGGIEFGFMLYWIQNPPIELQVWLGKHKLADGVWKFLEKIAPKPKLTTEEYDFILNAVETSAIPWVDGTLIGREKYEQLDAGWALAGINYAINRIDPESIFHPFPARNPDPISLTTKSDSGDPTLAIIGDWGTGYYKEKTGLDCPAQRVIDSLSKQSPDYLIHLGDVYYAGTDWRPLPGEELLHFVDLWPDQGEGRNFTLNSNHEMYGGANGYFDIALRSKAFAHQKGLSRFALTYGDWLVLGLDSAYYSDAQNGHNWYMEGAIGTTSETAQIDWLKGFRNHSGPIMILSHHNPCDTNTAASNVLYDQVNDALGRAPALWYWGHVHNGIVYKELLCGQTNNSLFTKGRCCGHAAIPFGKGWELEDNPNIEYYAHTPDPLQPKSANSPRVLNGYALVTLHKDGTYTESFYETENLKPVWPCT